MSHGTDGNDGPPPLDQQLDDGPILSTGDEPTAEDEEMRIVQQRRADRRRRMRRGMPGQSIGHLNLTPMMDIMTILLVFLVKSFASEPENININLGLRPPESTVQKMMEAATKVTVTSTGILVDDKEVMKLAEVDTTGERAAIPQLRDALLERADHLKALENIGGAPFDGRLLVVAHETTKYSVLTAVLVTAGESKFAEYKLVVMQKGAGG
jgi:biopolymer transport protein ExbD